MKTALTVVTALVLGSLAFAADKDSKDESSKEVDQSTNPFTGTKKTTETTKTKIKDGHGNEVDAKVKKVTKRDKRGKVIEKDVEVDSESKTEH